MKPLRSVLSTWFLLLLLTACQKVVTTTLLADGKVYELTTSGQLPSQLLSKAGIRLGANDRLLFHGSSIPLDQPLPQTGPYTLVVRRAVTLTLVTSQGKQTILTSAFTVGQALAEAGFKLYTSDLLDPPADTPIETSLTATYHPSQTLSISVDGTHLQIRSAASSVGQALTDAGIPLIGLDSSIPSEKDPIPADGKVRVTRVTESVILTQKPIPFATRTEPSADLGLDQHALLQDGEAGLAVTRTRNRSEDGIQVSQKTESENILRPPQDRIQGIGTKIVIRTAVVNGVTIEYWRALTLYATYYVPCIPGTNSCHYGTASGKKVQKGVVAMVYPWYLLFGGQPLFIPGYGFATVEDNNGAYTSGAWGTYWIDLGYSQTDTVDWTNHYVTVYFLTPVPANVANTYILP